MLGHGKEWKNEINPFVISLQFNTTDAIDLASKQTTRGEKARDRSFYNFSKIKRNAMGDVFYESMFAAD